MLQFEVEIDISKVAALAKKIEGTSKRLRRRLMQIIEAGLEDAREDMVRTYLSAPATTSTQLRRRTGNLIQSWRIFKDETAESADVTLRQDQRFRSSAYGATHEYGATIFARRVQNLAIPLTDEAERAGTPRKFPNLFIIKSRKGNVLLVQRNGRQIQPMFKLQPSVRIPPRPYLRPTAEKYFPRILDNINVELAALEREWNE